MLLDNKESHTPSQCNSLCLDFICHLFSARFHQQQMDVAQIKVKTVIAAEAYVALDHSFPFFL